jgi:hypothetical protein
MGVEAELPAPNPREAAPVTRRGVGWAKKSRPGDIPGRPREEMITLLRPERQRPPTVPADPTPSHRADERYDSVPKTTTKESRPGAEPDRQFF